SKVRVERSGKNYFFFTCWPPRFLRGLGKGCLARGGLEYESRGETFTPSGGIGGSTGGFRVQHTAQLDVTAGPEPLTTNN
ncbi:hypothetical protein Tco_0440896, partial [Tanacetum coccineum]